MVLITIVTGAYKPTFNSGGHIVDFGYPLVNIQTTIEHQHFEEGNQRTKWLISSEAM